MKRKHTARRIGPGVYAYRGLELERVELGEAHAGYGRVRWDVRDRATGELLADPTTTLRDARAAADAVADAREAEGR